MIPVTGKWDIDTEASEYFRDANQYVQTLRIYHEQGSPVRQEIGLKDFIPSSISWDSPLAPPNYESFASLFTRASQWFRDQASSHRYLNCQSVEMPLLNRGKFPDQSFGGLTVFRLIDDTRWLLQESIPNLYTLYLY